MPLLGKIEPGTISELIDSTIQSGSNAVLKMENATHKGEIHLESGEVIKADYRHHQLQETVDALCALDEGNFLLCRSEEHNANSLSTHNLPIWLLDDNQERRVSLHQSLAALGYSIGIITDAQELTALLHEASPKLLLLSEQLAIKEQQLLFGPLLTKSDLGLLLLGSPKDLPPLVASTTKGWLQWPQKTDQLEGLLRRWTAPHEPTPAPPENAGDILQVLSNITPPLDPRLQLQLSPSLPQAFKKTEIPEEWEQWLLAPPHQRTLQDWLIHYPGPIEQAQFVLHCLKQTGVLLPATQSIPSTQETHNDHTQKPVLAGLENVSAEEVSALADNEELQDSFVLLKVIVFGLRGKRREEWIDSLQQISQTQSARIPRDRTVQIPHIPKAELARIPLRSDSLLVVYGALTENAVDSLLDKIGTNLASFLFFIDFENNEELLYIRDLRKKLLARYPLPDLVMVSGSEGKEPTSISHKLELSGESLWHPIDKFNIRTSYKLLRILLLRTASSKQKNST